MREDREHNSISQRTLDPRFVASGKDVAASVSADDKVDIKLFASIVEASGDSTSSATDVDEDDIFIIVAGHVGFGELDTVVGSGVLSCERNGIVELVDVLDFVEVTRTGLGVNYHTLSSDATEQNFDAVRFEEASGRDRTDDVTAASNAEYESALTFERGFEGVHILFYLIPVKNGAHFYRP